MEACHKGLLFASPELDVPSDISCDEIDEWSDREWNDSAWDDTSLTPGEWLQVDICTEQKPPCKSQSSLEENNANISDSAERQIFLEAYSWLYLKEIKQNIEEKLLHARITKSQVVCPLEAALHDLGTLWDATVAKPHRDEEPQARIGIFSDIPQEKFTVEYITIPFDLNFTDFVTEIVHLGLVRHLTKKHHPSLAETLFLGEEIVYHHPYPTMLDESELHLITGEIYPITRDYDSPDNGWYAHVLPPQTVGMLEKQHDWRPINTEADWQSLLRVIRKFPESKVFMRHKSVEDRMELVRQHRQREELERCKTGGCYANPFLERHMEEMCGDHKLEGED